MKAATATGRDADARNRMGINETVGDGRAERPAGALTANDLRIVALAHVLFSVLTGASAPARAPGRVL